MKCPKCGNDVDMLKFTTTGTMCRSCHQAGCSAGAASPAQRMPAFYRPMGLPLFWRDEASGELPAAVEGFLKWVVGEAESVPAAAMKLVCDYCVYFIHAPVWEHTFAKFECEDYLAELNELKARSKLLASAKSVRRWNEECLDLGVDPF